MSEFAGTQSNLNQSQAFAAALQRAKQVNFIKTLFLRNQILSRKLPHTRTHIYVYLDSRKDTAKYRTTKWWRFI